MTSLRPLLPVVVLLLTPALAACGGDDEPEDTPPSATTPDSPEVPSEGTSSDTAGETSPTDPGSELTTDAAGGLPDPCDVLSSADVQAAFGVPFGEPSPGGGGYTEQDLEWQSQDCSFEAEDLVEVELALTGPDDFRAGDFQCPKPTEIVATVTPVDGLDAQQAWWKRAENPPLEATLRVCTESYNFDIELEYEDGVDFQGDPEQQSIALAEVVLAKLG